MTITELCSGIIPAEISGPGAAAGSSGVFDDSRAVRPGGVFVAVRGARTDGHAHIAQAVAAGAILVVAEEGAPAAAGAAALVRVPDSRAALARLAARWYGLDGPAGAGLRLVAVTGTNGKSTTAWMTRAILEAGGLRCGLLGTLGHDICGETRPSALTTPGALELARLLADCRARGADAVVMEASSHALAQRRCDGVRFAAAAFTNLTQDHLDYHASMDDYAAAKARLFAELLAPDGAAVVNGDDPFGDRMAQGAPGRVIRFGAEADADLVGRVGRCTLDGTPLEISGAVELAVTLAMVGGHNVSNALAAAGLGHALGVPAEAIGSALGAFAGVPGRLQRVATGTPFPIFVDYAHTPDAMRRVAATLRPLTRGRLVIVFGCGGERDRGKRPLMAQAAAGFADCLVLTSDNPRSEDPRRIIDDMLAGLDAATRRKAVVETDRRVAIRAALAAAHAGDCVLIAGKGHETVQQIGDAQVAFDDRHEASEAARLYAG